METEQPTTGYGRLTIRETSLESLHWRNVWGRVAIWKQKLSN